MRGRGPNGLVGVVAILATASTPAAGAELTQPANTWVKRSPLPGGPPSPRLGYEGACAWDPGRELFIRYGGHNQGGGGAQYSEVWTFDVQTAVWALKEPNTSPPGVCCAQQNVFDPVRGRYVRFPAFSGSHGWQWRREIGLNNATIWTYDPDENRWRNLWPVPAPRVSPLRCASWDSDAQVIVVFGGEGNREGTVVYDPHTNTWTWPKPSNQPSFRSGGNMVYDTARKVHILFGSQFSDDPHTWAYDLRKNEWRDLKPPQLPPTDRNDAVLAYDALNRVVVALVKITEGEEENARHRLETWVYDTSRNTWKEMHPAREPDPSGNRSRVLSFAPELGLTILENRTRSKPGPPEQQIWTYRYASAENERPAPPEPPVDVQVNGATLRWKPGPSEGVTHYHIYRGTGDRPWQAEYEKIATVDAKQRSFTDRAFQRETVYHYFLRAARGQHVGPPSTKVRTQPPIIEDVVVDVRPEGKVEIDWSKKVAPWRGHAAADAQASHTGWHVERAVVEVWSDDQLRRQKGKVRPLTPPSVGAVRRIGPFVRLTKAPLDRPRFVDDVNLARPGKVEGEPLYSYQPAAESLDPSGAPYPRAVYAYRVRAVNVLGVVSGPSPATLTIPSAPEWVFAQEDGTTCRLEWKANPETDLRGYRVYRLDGRWDKDPMSRLTAEPIRELTFTDEAAGEHARRYHVVAVDALGQEGFPSAPVWYNREWKPFYQPFTGDRHQ